MLNHLKLFRLFWQIFLFYLLLIFGCAQVPIVKQPDVNLITFNEKGYSSLQTIRFSTSLRKKKIKWTLNGPGELSEPRTAPTVIYKLPLKLFRKKDRAQIKLTIYEDGETKEFSNWLHLVAPNSNEPIYYEEIVDQNEYNNIQIQYNRLKEEMKSAEGREYFSLADDMMELSDKIYKKCVIYTQDNSEIGSKYCSLSKSIKKYLISKLSGKLKIYSEKYKRYNPKYKHIETLRHIIDLLDSIVFIYNQMIEPSAEIKEFIQMLKEKVIPQYKREYTRLKGRTEQQP